MAKLIVKLPNKPDEIIELKPGKNRFGRNFENDHPISDPSVSERHCELIVNHDFVLVRDLGSTNGTYIDQNPVKEAALYSGQMLQLGTVEMTLDLPPVNVALPELPKPAPVTVKPGHLADGYPSCLTHHARHAVWECTKCARPYCDDCVRKLRRVGGSYLRLCAACSSPCKLSEWSELIKRRRRGFIGRIVGAVKDSFNHTTLIFGKRKKKNKDDSLS